MTTNERPLQMTADSNGPEDQTVLIVSDDYAHVRDVLKELGYLTAVVPNAGTAQALFNQLRPAMVILDYNPDGFGPRGFPYFVRSMSHFKQTPLLALVDRDPQVARQALEEGFDDVCSKPVIAEVLAAKTRHAIGLPQKRG